MNIYKPLFILFSIVVLLTPHTNAQTKKSHEIAAFMKQSYEKGRFNGTVLVAQNNSILYNASFGYTDASKTEKLTTDYRFHIGSITKEFSAVALMQLQEQGKLKIEDKVSKFIPELPEWANDVTLRDLLQYTSGIPDVNWKKIKNDNDLLEGLQQVDSLDFKPGTQYDYNNNNLFLRQFIIERVTGMSFKTYAEQFLFKPCKMNASVMTPFENEKNIAKGFNNQLVADKPDLPITGGTYLTTTDLLKWADCLHSHKLIRANAVYELGQHFDEPETQSALGEVTFRNKKLLQHIHDGRAGNYEALLVTNREEKYTIILLGNNHHGKLFEIADAITVLLKSGE